MFQTLSFCFRIGGPPPLIEEILWFGDIGLANLITQSRCVISLNDHGLESLNEMISLCKVVIYYFCTTLQIQLRPSVVFGCIETLNMHYEIVFE